MIAFYLSYGLLALALGVELYKGFKEYRKEWKS